MKLNVLLDTSFFVRLLNDADALHTNAMNYFKYFLEQDMIMKVSTISTLAHHLLLTAASPYPLTGCHLKE